MDGAPSPPGAAGDYSGEVNDRGEKHGRGQIRYADGRVYDGSWRDDKKHGSGCMVYGGGDVRLTAQLIVYRA